MYFLLETDYSIQPIAYRTSSLIDTFKFKPSRWLTGRLLDQPKQTLRVEFWKNGGAGCAEILLDSIPLFSKKLVNALNNAGVDNLQTFPIDIVERDGDRIDNEYLAVNILGCIKCADLDASQYTDSTGSGSIAVNFRHLVIDDSSLSSEGPYLLRMAESVGSIIIDEKIKLALEKQAFSYLKFRPLPKVMNM